MPSAPSDEPETREVIITFRNEGRALYDDRGERKLDLDLPRDQLLLDTVDFLRSLVESAKEEDCTELLVVLGRHLYEFVFGTQPDQGAAGGQRSEDTSVARQRFDGLLEWAQQANDHLLILRLNFEPDAWKLGQWPWEIIYHPGGPRGWNGYFLRAERVVVLREVNSQRDMRSESPPIKILLATAGAKGDAYIKADQVHGILAAHGEGNEPRVELEVRDDVTFTELKKAIGEFKPDVFHFHGHGDGSGGVRLPKPKRPRVFEADFTSNTVPAVTNTAGESVAALFDAHQPQLVILTACETAVGEVPFSDVADQLAKKGVGIPAVVAMQFEVSADTAIAFAQTFYDSLLVGQEPVAQAFAAGVTSLADQNAELHGRLGATRTFGTPVLFLNPASGRLIVRSERAARSGGIPGLAPPSPPLTTACVFCGASNVTGNFCGDCGKPTACQCGARYAKWSKFCIECGRPLPEREAAAEGDGVPRAPLRAVSAAADPPPMTGSVSA